MKTKFTLFYSAAWLVLYTLYGLMLLTTPETSLWQAQRATFFTVVPAALMGLAAWWFCSRVHWTGFKKGFFALHVLAAITYSVAWTGMTLAEIAFFQPRQIFMIFVQRAMGWQAIMGLLIYGVIAGVAYLVQINARLTEQRMLAAKAELLALRAQLNPHFLFNTLHSITALAGDDAGAVEGALVQFGSLLRYVLDAGARADEDATLDDELRFVRGYLDLEKLRLGSRLTVVEDIDADTLDCLIPALTLQPLVENAVRHGIAPRAEGGVVRITSRLLGERVSLEISDDGPGASSESMKKGGVGLSLVKQRIEARFADSGTTSVDSTAGQGFKVTLSFPAISGMPDQRVSEARAGILMRAQAAAAAS